MHLLNLELFGKPLTLDASMAGWQQLFWGNDCVSQITASEAAGQEKLSHKFELTHQLPAQEGEEPTEHKIEIALDNVIEWQPFGLEYQLHVDGETVASGSLNEKDIEQREIVDAGQSKPKFSTIGLLGLGLKLFKSAKVIKVLLAAGSLAAYSWLFSFQFAVALILCLVFHEYGHVKAMKYFGMKTKGFYLIPFLGGMAVTDEKINTRWQDVFISIMGPFFGLILSIACLIGYWITDIEILGGLAVFNALLNLFQLLPVLPLDGGHVLKSIAYSVNSKVGLAICVLGAALGVYVSYYFGLALLGFLLALGSIEIFFEYKYRHNTRLLPLDRYGQIVSAIWYLVTAGGLAAIIWIMGQSANEALALPFKILGS
ncbi:MAG: metalloprotease [Psychrobium sp.]